MSHDTYSCPTELETIAETAIDRLTKEGQLNRGLDDDYRSAIASAQKRAVICRVINETVTPTEKSITAAPSQTERHQEALNNIIQAHFNLALEYCQMYDDMKRPYNNMGRFQKATRQAMQDIDTIMQAPEITDFLDKKLSEQNLPAPQVIDHTRQTVETTQQTENDTGQSNVNGLG